MTAYSAIQIGNAIIEEAKEHDERVSPMKLLKLAYYAHGWHLAILDEPLIDEGVEAWQYGPVVKTLYHQFKEFGKSGIDRLGLVMDYVDGRFRKREPKIDTQDEELGLLFPRMWSIYGGYTAAQLSNATHADGTPWRTIYDLFDGDIPPSVKIPDEVIKAHFKEKLS